MQTLLDDRLVAPFANLWLILMGLVVGSFLNVVIARVPEGLSVVRPRSRCPHCGHSLSWYENLPLLSWLFLRGRCRGCKAPISVMYPLVEALTAVLFFVCLRQFDWTPELALALVFVCLLIPLTFIDLRHYLLPFSLTLPGIAAGLGMSLWLGLERFRDSLIGAAVGFGLFWGLEVVASRVLKKEALGGGDKFLLAMIGAFLTYRPLMGIVFLSSLQGSVLSLILLATRGRAGPMLPGQEEPAPVVAPPVEAGPVEGEEEEEDDWVPGPTNMPFGPYLALAALEILLLSPLLERLLPNGTQWMVTWRF